MTPTELQEPAPPLDPAWPPGDDAPALAEGIAAALAEGTLYLRLDPAAVWLVD